MKKQAKKPNLKRKPLVFAEVGRGAVKFFMMGIVLLAALRQGLFWPADRLLFQFLIFTVGGIWLIYRLRNCKTLSLRAVDLAGMGLLMCYLAGIWHFASVNGAINGLLTWAAYLVVFWVFSTLNLSPREMFQFAYGLIGVSTIWALGGLGAYVRVITGESLLQGDRLSAGMGYANSAGSLFMLGLLLALLVAFQAEKKWEKMLFSTSSIILVTALLLTQSRGAWLAFAGGVLILLIVYRREIFRLFPYLVFMGAMGVIATASVVVVSNWKGFAGLLFISVIAGIIAEPFARFVGRKFVFFALIFLIISGSYAYMGYSSPNKYTLANNTGAAVNKTYSFSVTGLEPAESYTFQAQVLASNKDTKKAPYAIQVSLWALSDGKVGERLLVKNIVEGEYTFSHPLTLPSGADGVELRLINIYPATEGTII
ncbi:MAG: O-antigen ligase family protein [bacterium]|nr:O-antigen ligase family protein [bacterium]